MNIDLSNVSVEDRVIILDALANRLDPEDRVIILAALENHYHDLVRRSDEEAARGKNYYDHWAIFFREGALKVYDLIKRLGGTTPLPMLRERHED